MSDPFSDVISELTPATFVTPRHQGRSSVHVRIVRPVPGCTLVEVSGEVDLVSCPAFSRTLAQVVAASPRRRVVVELTAVEFLAACGIDAIVRARDDAERQRGALTVVIATSGPAAAAVGRTVRLCTDLIVHHTRATALTWAAPTS